MPKPIKLEEYQKWIRAEYPYDNATCGHCATMHASYYACMLDCTAGKHAAMVKDAKKQKLNTIKKGSRTLRCAVLAFRKKWAKFYPASPSKETA